MPPRPPVDPTETSAAPATPMRQVMELEQARFDLIRRIEEARWELRRQHEEKRVELLTKNKDQIAWLLETLSELRKERVAFQKKAIPEIAGTLGEAKVEVDQMKAWLDQITTHYHNDLSLAQRMIAVDIGDIDRDVFEHLQASINKTLTALVDVQLREITGAAPEAVTAQEPAAGAGHGADGAT